ncbi:MAG: GNAT family N-acetyltransferase [Hydrococcus sp. Prado102]|jgi:ribosomal protein S18 acetylase RimI-like enzyme|nr:GNAT family N-acetyltransferase [Hydrococcus sp. Prado102]
MDFRHIQYCDRKSDLDLQQLQALFNLGAFWAQNRNIEDLKIAIENSDPVISVWDGEKLIGFARATSDGIYRATIWDVIVHPAYQGFGIGRKLVETLISHPRLNRVERVYLTTTHQQQFYKRIGFEQNHTTTMILENSPSDPIRITRDRQLQPELAELNTANV